MESQLECRDHYGVEILQSVNMNGTWNLPVQCSADILKEVFLRCHIFILENCAQKKSKKKCKCMKIINFPVCKPKSKNVAQSQKFFALSHGGETMTFRNFDVVQ